MSGTTTVRETERKYESDGPLDAGLVAELATAIAGAPDRDAPTPREPTPLGPVVELDTVRREWTLTDAKGNAVATDEAGPGARRPDPPWRRRGLKPGRMPPRGTSCWPTCG
jgi:hypothetical protein